MIKDSGKTILTKVVVGSRLHGLEGPNSDWDYRGVHLSPLINVLSPFKKNKNTSFIEGDIDNTSYELTDFCKGATKGNATILEVFFSDQIIENSAMAQEMRDNWYRFMSTKHFINASRGYAHNQWNKFYNFESKGIKEQERTAKFAIAFLRVMWQCEQFLLTGEFKCRLEDCDMFDLMKKIKPMGRSQIIKVLPEIVEAMSLMDMRLAKAEGDAQPAILALEPDYAWIENFIKKCYLTVETLNNDAKSTLDYVKEYEQGNISAENLAKKIRANT